MTVDDIKATVKDYAIDKCTLFQVVYLQRYFIKEYCCWMPWRAIAEVTGSEDHTCVRDAVCAVKNNSKLFNISLCLKVILDAKVNRKYVKTNGVRLWYPPPKYKKRSNKVGQTL